MFFKMGEKNKKKSLVQTVLEKLSDLLNAAVGSCQPQRLLMSGCLLSHLPFRDFDNESQRRDCKGRGRVCRVRGRPSSCLPVLCLRHR